MQSPAINKPSGGAKFDRGLARRIERLFACRAEENVARSVSQTNDSPVHFQSRRITLRQEGE